MSSVPLGRSSRARCGAVEPEPNAGGRRRDEVLDRGRLVLAPDRAKVERLRGMFRDLAPAGGVVDELIAERREEARREDAD